MFVSNLDVYYFAKYKIKCVLDDEGYVKTIELRYVN